MNLIVKYDMVFLVVKSFGNYLVGGYIAKGKEIKRKGMRECIYIKKKITKKKS
jgi:hypothetical protein